MDQLNNYEANPILLSLFKANGAKPGLSLTQLVDIYMALRAKYPRLIFCPLYTGGVNILAIKKSFDTEFFKSIIESSSTQGPMKRIIPLIEEASFKSVMESLDLSMESLIGQKWEVKGNTFTYKGPFVSTTISFQTDSVDVEYSDNEKITVSYDVFTDELLSHYINHLDFGLRENPYDEKVSAQFFGRALLYTGEYLAGDN